MIWFYMKKYLLILIFFFIIPTFIFAKEIWKPVSPGTVVTQSKSGWKATKVTKQEYDQLAIQKKTKSVVNDKTSFSFRYRIHSNREILYLQFSLIPEKGQPYFVILPRPIPDTWHQVTVSRAEFRTFDYRPLSSNMKIKAIELSLNSRGKVNEPAELEISDILINKPPKVEARYIQPLPLAGLSNDTGIAAFYIDTTESNATMLKLKSGPFIGLQADQNSFTLTGFGDSLLLDSGYFDTDTSRSHYLGWTIQTKAHNTILVDGYGQAISTPGADGKIIRYLTLGNMGYFAGDASSPEIYQGRVSKYIRNIFMLDSSLYLVYDNLDSKQSVRYDWLLHSIYPFSVDKDRKMVQIIGKNAKLDIQFLNPEPLGYTLSSGFSPAPERTNPTDLTSPRLLQADQYHFSAYPRLDSKIDWIDVAKFAIPELIAAQMSTKKQTMNWLAALYLSPIKDTTELNVIPMSTGDWLGGTIQLPRQTYHYLLSRDTGANTLGYQGYSFTGRGAIIGIGTTGNFNRLILLDAQQVKMLGMPLFNASTPVTMLAEIDKNHAEIQFAVDKDATIAIPPFGEPKEIYIDGIIQSAGKLWNYDSDTGKLVFSLPAGTHSISVTYSSNEEELLKLPSQN